jgi:hypothetical protein
MLRWRLLIFFIKGSYLHGVGGSQLIPAISIPVLTFSTGSSYKDFMPFFASL